MSQQDEILSLRTLNGELTERVRVAELAVVAAESNIADLLGDLLAIRDRATTAIKA